MRLAGSEISLILVIFVLCIIIYNQSSDIDSLLETLDMQSDAISRQQSLIQLQMNLIEYHETEISNPVHKNEGKLL